MWVSQASEKESVLVLSHLAAWRAGLAGGGEQKGGRGAQGPESWMCPPSGLL